MTNIVDFIASPEGELAIRVVTGLLGLLIPILVAYLVNIYFQSHVRNKQDFDVIDL